MMNPDSNKFENLTENREEYEKRINELSQSMIVPSEENKFHKNLLRPDGTLVPAHWKIFKVGELITVKDYTFKISHIGESYMVVEPVKTEDLVIKSDKENED